MIKLDELFHQYHQSHRALPAFNIDSFEIYQSVEKAVAETNLPCLVQLSANEDQFITAEKLYLLVRGANLRGLPIYLNMDHCHDLDRMKFLASLGFDMLHFDGSSHEFSENLSLATQFITEVKTINPHIIVEVEFNHINLIEKGLDTSLLTDPNQAKQFMETSGADLLAVSIGNLHGVNTSSPEKIDLELFQKIIQELPTKMFTLHGGSGIALEQVKNAISMGIVKININTDLRLQFKKSLSLALSAINSEKLYDYFTPVIKDVAEVVKEKLIQFNSSL